MSQLSASLIPDLPSPTPIKSKSTRILVVADNPAATRDVATSLRHLGLDIILSLYDGEVLTSLPVKAPDAILCHLTDYVGSAKKIARVLRAQYAGRQLPLICALSRPMPNISEVFDSTLFAPMHASQIANRVNSMIRLGAMETEIKRRMETAANTFDEVVTLGNLSLDRRFRVLFIGKASPGFMIIINALQGKGVDVVAAFTSFSAFDYLHGDPFDAVVMNALEQSEPAMTISTTMRRNATLYHVPTLFVVDDKNFQHRDAAFESGVRDVISIDSDADEIRGRVLELANYHRVHETLKREMFDSFGDVCRDASKTVFSKAFFEAHLPSLLNDAQTSDQPLTLIALNLVPVSTVPISNEVAEAAFTQAGRMISGFVRMQDVVSRYDTDCFIIAFYGSDAGNAEKIRDRITSLLDNNRFEDFANDHAALVFETRATVVQAWPDATAPKLMQEVIEKLR